MQQNKKIWLVIGFLIIANTFSLILHWLPFPPAKRARNHGPELGKKIEQELNLSESQKMEYKNLREIHHAQMVLLNQQNTKILSAYLNELKSTHTDKAKMDSLEQQLSIVQTQKARISFAHFQELKTLLSPAQQEKFHSLIPIFVTVIAPPQGPPPRNK